ncbi:MAG TPA: ABC transporter substrate-binding protein [Patescibacteria group bacterium]
MIKSLREQFWYATAFLKKYIVQIGVGLFITLFLGLGFGFASRFLPKSKPSYRVGVIGQYTASQLPPALINLLNDGLTAINDTMEPIPNVAEKWDIQDNGNTYVFYLKPGLKWSDGTDVKPQDIKMTIPGVSIETADPNIIKFKIPSKFSPFPSLLNFPLVNYKGKVIGDYDIKLKQKTSGSITQAILDSKKENISFNVYSTTKQAITSFKLGQTDLILNMPSSEVDKDISQYGFTRKTVNDNQVVILIFNQADANLKDKNVRQGLAYAIKDKAFGEDPAISTINPNSWAFNPLSKTYPYNIQRTKELIKSPMSLELSTQPELLPIAEQIKNQLDSDLIQISIKVVTSTPDQFQLFLTTYNIPIDPDQYRDWHSTQAGNIGKNTDEKIDKALEDGRTTLDIKERKKIYLDFQKYFSEELPALTLFHPSYLDIARKQAYFDVIKNSPNSD